MRLEVRGLAAGYGRAEILRDIDMEIAPGTLALLLGRNGAGKSTLLKALIGLVPPHAGSVRADGMELAGLKPHHIARHGIGYVPEERRIFSALTVAENLEVGRRGGGEWTPARLFALFPVLAELARRPAGRISGGEQQMLAIARTLAGNPSLLLLDEPTEGLAPVIVAQLAAALRGLCAAGTSILLTEQSLGFARAMTAAPTEVPTMVLQSGRIAWRGALASLLADAELRARLLAV